MTISSTAQAYPLRDVGVDGSRALDAVRVVVATLLAVHPLYGALRPEYVRSLVAGLDARGLPVGVAAVWIVGGLSVAFSVALVARRFVALACVGHIALLIGGMALFHAPRWYVVGGAVDDGGPGCELHVLAIACLAAVLRRATGATGATATKALAWVRVVAALNVLTHPLHALLTWDVEGMHAWGEGMEARGFPMGVPLVWSVIFVQVACSLALLAKRHVVPACVGHLVILCVGIFVSHAPRWFVVGPGESGMEYSVLLVACFGSVLAAALRTQRS